MRIRRARWHAVVWAICLAVPVLLLGLAAVSIAGSAVALTSARVAATPDALPPDAAVPAGVTDDVAEDEVTAAPTAAPVEPVVQEPVAPPDPLRPACPGATSMSVWAHTDDDLLFASSTLRTTLDAGGCVRTVFLTDGDAGRGADYAAGRQRGIQRAYDVLRGASSPWESVVVPLATGAVATVTRPADDPRVTIVFLRLPDGGPRGDGHPSTGGASLAKLAADRIPDVGDTAGSYRVSWSALVASLAELVNGFAPASFYTHVPGSAHTLAKGDHADHAITGILARSAWYQAALPGTIGYAVGYQISNYPSNVSGADLDRKIAAFAAYAADDPVVDGCRDHSSCLALPRFGGWLTREYLKTEADLGLG